MEENIIGISGRLHGGNRRNIYLKYVTLKNGALLANRSIVQDTRNGIIIECKTKCTLLMFEKVEENIVVKEKSAHNQQFLIFRQLYLVSDV